MKIDYIIVGQGLAGSLLGYFLLQHKKKILFIDNQHHSSSSKIAAGIFNPITGRRFVKSWKVDELFPFAKKVYQEIEKEFQIKIYYPQNIIRELFNHTEEMNWIMRSDLPEYKNYVEENVQYNHYEGKIKKAFSSFELKNTGRVDIAFLIETFKKSWLKKNMIFNEIFEYDKIQFNEEDIHYKDIICQKIIFCEGHQGRNNPYFSYLDFQVTKGEILLVKIPNTQYKKILKHKVYIVPYLNDLYWVGATNDWNDLEDIPTSEKKLFLEKKLNEILNVPYTIVQHQAGLRPTVKDRRPFLGLHPKYNKLGIFNGLGTKGASLAPFWANEMALFLSQQKKLDSLVNITRKK